MDKVLHPYCNVCGWRKGGLDSWNGRACKCGHSAPPMRPLTKEEAPLEHPVDILHDQLVQAHGADKIDHPSFEEAKRFFDATITIL